MIDERKAAVAAYLKKSGLEGGVIGSGLEFAVRVGCGDKATRTFKIDHRLFSRSYTEDALLERMAEIVDSYNEGTTAQ